MYWIRRLGPDAVELFGPARTIIIYTVAGVSGFFLSSTAGYIGIPIPLLRGASFPMKGPQYDLAAAGPAMQAALKGLADGLPLWENGQRLMPSGRLFNRRRRFCA